MKRVVYSIDVPWACFGLIVEGETADDAVVVESAPIAGWCTGKLWKIVYSYWRAKGAEIVSAGVLRRKSDV